MRLRQKGQQFSTQDCAFYFFTTPSSWFLSKRLSNTNTVEAFLIAYGDDDHPLPETVKVLDEIITECVGPSPLPYPTPIPFFQPSQNTTH